MQLFLPRVGSNQTKKSKPEKPQSISHYDLKRTPKVEQYYPYTRIQPTIDIEGFFPYSKPLSGTTSDFYMHMRPNKPRQMPNSPGWLSTPIEDSKRAMSMPSLDSSVDEV